jgi:hypothetical protein
MIIILITSLPLIELLRCIGTVQFSQSRLQSMGGYINPPTGQMCNQQGVGAYSRRVQPLSRQLAHCSLNGLRKLVFWPLLKLASTSWTKSCGTRPKVPPGCAARGTPPGSPPGGGKLPLAHFGCSLHPPPMA